MSNVLIRAEFVSNDKKRVENFDGYEMHMFFADRGQCLEKDYVSIKDALSAIKEEYLGADCDNVGVTLYLWDGSFPCKWINYDLALAA